MKPLFAALAVSLLSPGVSSTAGAAEEKPSIPKLTPPVSLKAQPIEGKGDRRKAELEITNNSDKTIGEVVVDVFFLDRDREVGRSVPHTESWTLGNPKDGWDAGKRTIIEIGAFFMEDDTASVDGIVSSIVWKDGTRWPDWTGPAPEKLGDEPVVAKFLGLVGEGTLAQPAVGLYNVGFKGISSVMYGINYLDAGGSVLGGETYGYSGDDDWLPAGKSAACTGSSGPPPEGTVELELTVSHVTFADEAVWQPEE